MYFYTCTFISTNLNMKKKIKHSIQQFDDKKIPIPAQTCILIWILKLFMTIFE